MMNPQKQMFKGRDCEVYFTHGIGIDTNLFAEFYGDKNEIKRKF